jgi:hypothetical protein
MDTQTADSISTHDTTQLRNDEPAPEQPAMLSDEEFLPYCFLAMAWCW